MNHEAGKSALPSSGAHSSHVEGWCAPSPLGQPQKRAHHAPTTITLVAPRKEEATLLEAPPSSDPSEAINGPLGSSMLPTALQGGPPIPYHIHQLALPARSFKQDNLKGSCKMYICGECEKHTSKRDSMVSHCLQEHLGVNLVCPQCKISYLDPSKF